MFYYSGYLGLAQSLILLSSPLRLESRNLSTGQNIVCAGSDVWEWNLLSLVFHKYLFALPAVTPTGGDSAAPDPSVWDVLCENERI